MRPRIAFLLISLMPYAAVYAVLWGEQAPADDPQRLAGWLIWTVVASLYFVTLAALLACTSRPRAPGRPRGWGREGSVPWL